MANRVQVLDPVDRVSEIIFGLLMALSFTGSLSVVTAHDEIRTVLAAALGCNLAWGLVDGVMYLVAVRVERARATSGKKTRAIAGLTTQDFLAAAAVFAFVVVATFPVVLPFLFLDDVAQAMRTSNAIALVTLYIAGDALGRHAGITPWRAGLTFAILGAVLVAIIMALGG